MEIGLIQETVYDYVPTGVNAQTNYSYLKLITVENNYVFEKGFHEVL